MDHCKNKQRHKWVPKYNMMHECSVCGKIKMWKTVSKRKNKSHAKGSFGKVNKLAGVQNDMKVIPRHKRKETPC